MKTWSFILDKSKKNQRLVLLVVIDNQGSSPGRKGFKMAVSEDGQLSGSIGGGIMEQEFVEEARRMIAEQDNNIKIKYEKHNNEDLHSKSEQATSGRQIIAFYPISDTTIGEFEAIVSCIKEKKPGIIKYSQLGISFHENVRLEEKFQNKILSDKEWELSEQIGLPDTLYIFGAGHVSLALSRVCNILNFDIELFDNRNDLNTFHENQYINKKQIINYDDIGHLVQEGSNSYVVIMSSTHPGDENLLAQLLDKKLMYLGMLGSNKKVKKIKANLIEKGCSEDHLNNIHAPIGIPINSQTPEEIAISITAEIIGVRNAVTGDE